jgi:hypothetical protein
LYPDFDDIYQRHVKDAKFKTIRGQDFKSLKEHLALLYHLLEKNQNLGSETRTELIQALISERDLRHAQKVLPKCETNKKSGVGAFFSLATSILLPGLQDTDGESLQKEMKKITNGFSDSDFLLKLKNVHDEDLQSPIQQATALAHTQLSSSIDAAVKKMTPIVLRMQQDHCKKAVKLEIEAEERKLLGDALSKFICEINACAVGRKES